MRAPLAVAATLFACTARQMPPPAKLAVAESAEPKAALHGSSAQVASIAQRYWATLLATTPLPLLGEGSVGGPLNATALGDHRFDARLDDLSAEAHRRLLDALAQLRAELTTISTAGLTPDEEITVEMLRKQLTDADAVEACSASLWVVDQMDGPQVALAQTAYYYPLETSKGAADLAARYGQAGRYF